MMLFVHNNFFLSIIMGRFVEKLYVAVRRCKLFMHFLIARYIRAGEIL